MEPTDRLDLRWNGFEANTRDAFRKLRGGSEFCDVTLACNGNQVSAHKIILAGGSPFFQQLLKQNPHPHPLIYLKGVRYDHLLSVLDFVYTGEATIIQEELNSFLELADDLQIKGLLMDATFSSKKPDETILSNAVRQDQRSAVKEEIGTQPEVSLSRIKTSLHVNNWGSQSSCQENQFDSPLPGNIKIEVAETVHSDVSFGMKANDGGFNNGEEIVELEAGGFEPKEFGVILGKKEMTIDRSEPTEELRGEGTKKTSERGNDFRTREEQENNISWQNHDELRFSSAVTFPTPDSISTYQHKSDSLIQSSKLTGPHDNNTCIKSDSKENHDQIEMPVDDNIKIENGDTSNNDNFEEDILADNVGMIISNCEMTLTELAASVFNNDEVPNNWYEESEEYGNKTETAGSAAEDKEVTHYWDKEGEEYTKDISVKHNVEQGKKVCFVCGQSVRCNTELKVHMRIHTGERPFLCVYCPKRFTRKSDLNRHTKIHTREKPIHTGENPFLCLYCPKKFPKSSHLVDHTRIHTGEKPFLCLYCPKKFPKSSHLVEHTRIHTGEKPFQCSLCYKRFTQSSQLKSHKKKCSMID